MGEDANFELARECRQGFRYPIFTPTKRFDKVAWWTKRVLDNDYPYPNFIECSALFRCQLTA